MYVTRTYTVRIGCCAEDILHTELVINTNAKNHIFLKQAQQLTSMYRMPASQQCTAGGCTDRANIVVVEDNTIVC